MGVTFKENCSDTRNSQILKLIEYYKKKYQVDIYDPYVQENLNEYINSNKTISFEWWNY